MLGLIQKLVQMEWPVRLLNPLMGGFNPFLPEYRADPYQQYHALRARQRVRFHPLLRIWVASGYAESSDVLRDGRFSVDRAEAKLFGVLDPLAGLSQDFNLAIRRSLLMLDPPDHTRIRSLVNRAFTPRVVEGLRDRIQSVVDELLNRVEPAGEMELIRDLAYPLPVIVIAELLGVSTADREDFKRWSDDLTILIDPMQGRGLATAQESFTALRDYLLRTFEERRRDPRNDLISALVAVEEDGRKLDQTELISVCGLILGAGHETTTNLIGNAVMALLRHPDERRRLLENPELIGSAVEEFLRYDSPVQATDRMATEDCEVGGQNVRRGDIVLLLLGAANRDPAQFPDPDRLDIGRTDNRHLSFGQGAHFCLGAALARLEGQIAISTMLRRFPALSGDPTSVTWKRSMVLRGVEALPLRLR